MQARTAPGIYFDVNDFSDYSPALATTSYGVVGTATKGPIGIATLCSSVEDYISKFGEPSSYGSFAAVNYLRQGNRMYFTRVARVFDQVTSLVSTVTAVNSLHPGLTVGAGHGISIDDYIEISEPGLTSHRSKVSGVTGDVITLTTGFRSDFTTAATVKYSISTAGAGTAETFLLGRLASTVRNVVHVKAKNSGTWANFGTSRGLEVVVTDGGNFANIDPVSNSAVVAEAGYALQGVGTSRASVDDLDLLYALTSTEVRTGAMVGVNNVRTVFSATSVAATSSVSVTINYNIPVNSDTIVVNGTTLTKAASLGAAAFSSVAELGTLIDAITGLSVSTVDDEITVTGASVVITLGTNTGTMSVTPLPALSITAPGVAANDYFTAGDNITLRGTAYDVVSAEIISVEISGNNTVIVVASPTTPVAPTTVVATIENLDDPISQALVLRCASSNSVGSTWVASGVLTKRITVFYKGQAVESFENLIGYDPQSPNYWDTAVNSDYITVQYLGTGEQPMNSLATATPNNVRYLLGLSMSVRETDSSSAAYQNVYVTNGSDGDAPGSADYFTGLQPFRRKETYEIDIVATPGVSTAAVINEAMAVCASREDAIALIDPPFGLSKQEVIDWHNGQGSYSGQHDAFTGSFGACFYPWVRQYDPYGRTDVWVPPSAVVGAQMAFSDKQSEVWFAPAGITRGSIMSANAVEVQLEDGDVETMYGPANGNAINPIRQYEKDGIVIMGQRTLQRFPSSLDRIQVRRLVSYIIRSARSSSRRLAFEQNDEILWSQARGVLTPLLTNLKGRRAIEFFSLVCDHTNNTPLRRNQNQTRVDINVIPTKAGEVVTIGLNLFQSGVTVEQITSVVASL